MEVETAERNRKAEKNKSSEGICVFLVERQKCLNLGRTKIVYASAWGGESVLLLRLIIHIFVLAI